MKDYMQGKNIDRLFKEKLGQLEKKETPLAWDKESSWERLQNKRKKKRIFSFYYYAAAILIVGFMLGNLYQSNSNNIKNDDSSNSFVEYQKREKLKELESRMSGNTYVNKMCFACDNYDEIIKKDRPDKFTYFETN